MQFCSELFLFLPCHDLGDLSSRSPAGAKSLLTAWTAAWHPLVLSRLGRLPQWYAADAAPEPESSRFALVPIESEPLLTSAWKRTSMPDAAAELSPASSINTNLLVVGDRLSRSEVVHELLQGPFREKHSNSDSSTETRWDADFFALGFNLLQVQRMTRKLRYSSNLDEVYFAQQAVTAATAAVSGDEAKMRQSLQICFDLLAQERDHYFAGDPYLVDLTLVAASQSSESLAIAVDADGPANWLCAADTLNRLADRNDLQPVLNKLRDRISKRNCDFAGGWYDIDHSPNQMTAANCELELDRAGEVYTRHLGRPTRVFARLGGGIPSDLLSSLVRRGYNGAIVADFLGGRDSGQRESKLSWQSGGDSLDAITCSPTDAANSLDLLNLGTQIGEAMDAGHVATLLLTHWAGQSCDALDDLRCATAWGLSLGRFVTLTEYFENSARSYHTFKPTAARAQCDWLKVETDVTNLSDNGQSHQPRQFIDPTRGVQQRFVAVSQLESNRIADGLLCWSSGQTIESAPIDSNFSNSEVSLAVSSKQVTLFNPHMGKLRTSLTTSYSIAAQTPGLLAQGSLPGKQSLHRLEIPGCGFVTVSPAPQPSRSWWSRNPHLTVSPATLHNEFMSVGIDPVRGSVQNVHTTGMRGNRFSLRLSVFDATDKKSPYSEAVADSVKIIHSDHVRGEISVAGRCVRGDTVEATFRLVYRLDRGSRLLEVSGEIEPHFSPDADPWNRYLAFRAAVHDPSVLPELLLRDRRMPASGRRFEAPLGLHLDMASYSVTVCAGGWAAHRRSEDRVFDTVVAIGGGKRTIRLAYGFDLSAPVHAARALIAPPRLVTSRQLAGSGYFLHTSPSSMVLTHAESSRQVIGDQTKDILDVWLIEPDGKTRNVKLTSAVPLESAFLLGQDNVEPKPLEVVDDAFVINAPGHSLSRLRLVRAAISPA